MGADGDGTPKTAERKPMSDINSILGDTVEIPRDEPAAETAPQDPPSSDPAPTDPPESHEADPPKMVPLAALHEERAKRREAAAAAEAMRQQTADIEARMQRRIDALYQQAQPKPQVPSLEENPAAHLAHQVGELRETQTQLLQRAQAEREQAQQQSALAQAMYGVQASEAAFVQQAPDYLSAVQHLDSLRVKELVALGMDEDQAAARSKHELREFAIVNAANGRNPAELAYRLAQAKGYKMAAPKADPAEKLANTQRGVAASQSLGSSSGASDGRITARQLASMSDEEFEAATAGKNWLKAMGG